MKQSCQRKPVDWISIAPEIELVGQDDRLTEI